MKRSALIKKKRKTVLVTGATSGIGREIVIKFAKKGWDIVCHYRSSDKKAKELKRAVLRNGVCCCLLKADFCSQKQLNGFIKRVKRFEIDSIINNAGTYLVNKHFSKLTIKEIENIFMINVFSAILLTSEIFMYMKKRRFGRIINISSIAAKYGGSSRSMPYGCSKLALEGVTKTLAKEGAEYNVLVNSIRPGVINTDFHKKFPKDMKKRIAMIPLKRMGTPGDIADIVYYLGSEKNNFITNEIFTVSGGE